jgi:rod shape-determining protein MreC
MKRLEIDSPPTTRRPVLLVVLLVSALVIMTVWYKEGAGGPIHAVRTGMLTVVKPFQVVGTAVTSPFRAVGSYLSGSSLSREEAAALKKQNTELKQRLAQLEEARLENERLQQLIQFAQVQNLQSIGARVIGRPAQAWEGVITIDRGAHDGMRVGAPVIAAGGLVGQVIEVSPWSSKVRLITDPDSGVAVLVQRTRATGIVRGNIDGRLALEFVDKAKLPKAGDVVLTSGMGGVYPKGLVVGDITDVAAPQADLYPQIAVTSRVALSDIEEVLVLTSPEVDQQPGGGE